MRKSVIIYGLFTALLMISGSMYAQDTDCLRCYDYVSILNPWKNGTNYAAILDMPVDKISRTEAYFTKNNGKFMEYSDSDDSFNAGLDLESYVSLGKIAFNGGVNYDYFYGRNMKGSVFTNPGEYPVDIIEFTPGLKTRETYNIYGGGGFKILKNLDGGFSLDYTSSNYAKRKDLRHKNSRMHLDFNAGILWRISNVKLGLSYLYGKKTERITSEEIGLSGLTYDAFLNKGLWYGTSGLWTDSGIHLQTPGDGINYFPLTDSWHGGAFQFEFEKGRWKLFNEFIYKSPKGETGEKGVIWTKSSANIFSDRMELSLRMPRMAHFLRGYASYEELKNNEMVLGRETENGITNTYIYGSRLIFQSRQLKMEAEYELDIFGKCGDLHPVFRGFAGIGYWQNSGVSSLMFPTYINRYIEVFTPYIKGIKTFQKRNNLIDASLGVAYSWGGGRKHREYNDRTGMTPGSYASYLKEYADYEWEYLTAPRIDINVGVRYAYLIKNVRQLYCKVGYGMTYCDQVRYIAGNFRHTVSFSAGYQF